MVLSSLNTAKMLRDVEFGLAVSNRRGSGCTFLTAGA